MPAAVLFPKYATFLRTKLLAELVAEEIAMLRQLDLPLLRLLSLKSEADIARWLTAREESFLAALERGEAMAWEHERLALWERDAIPGIPPGGLHPSDVLLFHTAQRSAFVRYVARFAIDPLVRVELLAEIETHFMDVLSEALRTYQRMRATARV